MNESTAIELQIRVALLAIAIEASRYDEIQRSPIYLPEVFAGNEDGGKRPMTKKELEDFIDKRWASAIRSLEAQNKSLQNRVADLEAEYSRLNKQISS
jgi:hypothetical protein